MPDCASCARQHKHFITYRCCIVPQSAEQSAIRPACTCHTTAPYQEAHLQAAQQPARVVADAAGALQAVLRKHHLHGSGREGELLFSGGSRYRQGLSGQVGGAGI